MDDRQRPLDQADQEDRVPLKALGRVQRGERDPLDGGNVLVGGTVGEIGDEPVEGGPGVGDHHVVGEPHERGQILPAFPLCARAVRRIVPPPSQRGEDLHDLGRETLRPVGVGRPRGRPQQPDGLGDLRPREEPLAAPDQVGDAGGGDRGLVCLGLGVDPVQHGDLAGRHVRVQQHADAAGDRGRLLGFAVAFGERRCRAVRTLRDQPQRFVPGRGGSSTHGRARCTPCARCPRCAGSAAGAGSRDQPVGQPDHLRRGAVVPHEADHRGVGEAPGEIQQVAGRRPGERVDGLVGVTDHAEAVPLAEPGVEQALLQRVDVLVLVHHEVPVARAQLLGDPAVLLDHGRGQQQQVVEVENARLPLGLLVGGVQTGDHLGRVRRLARRRGRGRRVLLGGEQGGLGPLDLGGEVPKLGPARRQVYPVRRPSHQCDLALDEPGQCGSGNLGPEVAELP